MTTSSANDPANLHGANLIADLFPRRRLRDFVNEMLTALHSDKQMTVGVRRMIAAATALFGDDVVHELHRAIKRDGQRLAFAAIVVLRTIATEPARTVLWHIGRERRYGPLLQLDALRALCQLDEPVDLHELVALANLCEHLTPPHGRDYR